jgi:hypothetical protein
MGSLQSLLCYEFCIRGSTGRDCTKQTHPHDCGVTAIFTSEAQSDSTGWSTMYPDADEVRHAMHIFLNRSLPSLEGMELNLLNRIGSLAKRRGPTWAINWLLNSVVSIMLASKQQYTCPLTTVSNIISSEV